MITRLKDVRVAAIMDQFTELCYESECTLCQLTPENWLEELVYFKPQLLFVESAWRGKNDLWKTKGNMPSPALRGIVAYCKSYQIPTMFWNKEDPFHYGHFLSVAWMFDYIFTTDMDSIPNYKRDTGKENVFFLPFAAQPRVHNPEEKYVRKNGLCFAGSYYKNHPEREVDFDALMDALLQRSIKVDIYDRNYGSENDDMKFPEAYKQLIRGVLPADEIDKAYKGYYYNINMNSIKDSSTMFARRVFELMASNTVVISNYAKGLRTLFGEYVIASDDPQVILNKLKILQSDDLIFEKYRLLGLRGVLTQHLYEDRMAYLADKIFGEKLYYSFPDVLVYSVVKTQDEWESVYKSFVRQKYKNIKMIVFMDERLGIQCLDTRIEIIPLGQTEKVMGSVDPESYISCFMPDDYYGEHYLTDLVLALRFTNADVICKKEHFQMDGNHNCIRIDPNKAYRYQNFAETRSSLFKAKRYVVKQNALCGGRIFAIDPFNYCENYSGNRLSYVDDLPEQYGFANLFDLYDAAETMLPDGRQETTVLEDNSFWENAKFDFVSVTKLPDGNLRLVVDEPDGKSATRLGEKHLIDFTKTYEFLLAGAFEAKVGISCRYYNWEDQLIGKQSLKVAKTIQLDLPADAVSFRLYITLKGEGTGFIHEMRLRAVPKRMGRNVHIVDPKISVIVPVYNTGKYLKECLYSITNQTLPDIEIICINDGSTDNSLEILKEIAQSDCRIKVYSQENKGLSATRNFGLKVARGEYVQFIDSDDLLDSHALGYLYSESKRNSLDILCFDAKSVFETKQLETEKAAYKTYYVRNQDYSDIYTGNKFFEQQIKDGSYRMSSCLVLIRRALLLEKKLLFYEGILHEDNLFTTQALLFAGRVSHRNRQLYIRRVREGSIMTGPVSLKNVEGLLTCCTELLKHQKQSVKDIDTSKALELFVDRLIKNSINNFKKITDSEKYNLNYISETSLFLTAFMLLMTGTDISEVELESGMTDSQAAVLRKTKKILGSRSIRTEKGAQFKKFGNVSEDKVFALRICHSALVNDYHANKAAEELSVRNQSNQDRSCSSQRKERALAQLSKWTSGRPYKGIIRKLRISRVAGAFKIGCCKVPETIKTNKKDGSYISKKLLFIDYLTGLLVSSRFSQAQKARVLKLLKAEGKMLSCYCKRLNGARKQNVISEIYRNQSGFLNRSAFSTRKAIAFCHNFAPFADASAYVSAKRLHEIDELEGRPLNWLVVSQDMGNIRAKDNLFYRFFADFQFAELRMLPGKTSFSATDQCHFGYFAFNEAKNEEAEVIYSRSQFVGSHLAAWLFKLSHPNVKWYAEFSDPLAYGIDNKVRKVNVANDASYLKDYFWDIEQIVYGYADKIIFTNKNQLNYMLGYNPFPDNNEMVRSKSVIMPHPVIPSVYAKIIDSDYYLDSEKINIGYFGNFYQNRSMDDMLHLLSNQKVILHIFTQDSEMLKGRYTSYLDRVRFNHTISNLEFLNLAAKMDYLFLHDAVFKGAINPYLPSKYADYRAVNTNIIAKTMRGSILSGMQDEHLMKVECIDDAFARNLKKQAFNAAGS